MSLSLFYSSLSYSQQQAVESELSQKPTWLVLGDSLSAAYGIEVKEGWVALMQEKYAQLNIINASISGETTSGGKQRLPDLLAKYQPEVLIIELGANDALRGQNLNITEGNIQSMIDMCPQYNQACQVILLGVRLPTNYGPAYDALFQQTYQQIAQKNNLLFDGFFLEPVALDPDLMQWDGLHPNALAQPVILNRLQPLFNQILML